MFCSMWSCQAELSALRATEEQAKRVIEASSCINAKRAPKLSNNDMASALQSQLKLHGQSAEMTQLQAQIAELRAMPETDNHPQ
eukprot:1871584-Amphidinium_carterae.1